MATILKIRVLDLKLDWFAKVSEQSGQQHVEKGDECVVLGFEPLPVSMKDYDAIRRAAKGHVIEVVLQ